MSQSSAEPEVGGAEWKGGFYSTALVAGDGLITLLQQGEAYIREYLLVQCVVT